MPQPAHGYVYYLPKEDIERVIQGEGGLRDGALDTTQAAEIAVETSSEGSRIARWCEPGQQEGDRPPQVLVEVRDDGSKVARHVHVFRAVYRPGFTQVEAQVFGERLLVAPRPKEGSTEGLPITAV